MSSKKPAALAVPADASAPVPKPARKPRKSKVQQPSWFKAVTGDTYRIIEDDSAEAVAARIVSVFPATPQDFALAGKDGVTLESKPASVTDA